MYSLIEHLTWCNKRNLKKTKQKKQVFQSSYQLALPQWLLYTLVQNLGQSKTFKGHIVNLQNTYSMNSKQFTL